MKWTSTPDSKDLLCITVSLIIILCKWTNSTLASKGSSVLRGFKSVKLTI